MATAISRPKVIQYGGWRFRRSSTHCVPPTMYWAMKAVAITRPATKPPPGSLWPRSSRWPVFSRAGGAGGVETGCFVWTLIADQAIARTLG